MSAVDIPSHDSTQGAVWNYVVQILYNPILALVKSSLLLLLLRLFGQKPGVRRFVIWVNTINLASFFSIFFAIVFQCFPLQKAWKPRLEGFCVDRRILFVAASAINIVLDLLILGLPLHIFVGLQIPKRTKIALIFVFLLGFLTTLVGISHLVLLVRGLYVLLNQPDPTSNISFVIIAIEANLSIITASAPALRPLLRTWFPASSSKSGGEGWGGGTTATTRQRERRDTVAVSAATDKMVLGAGAAARIGRLRSAAASSRRSDDEASSCRRVKTSCGLISWRSITRRPAGRTTTTTKEKKKKVGFIMIRKWSTSDWRTALERRPGSDDDGP
ncbi:CFEM domain-containing protein [Apiospora phragmitis]|uniref:CFEM domain-containing protein n=1 Tax=Apiospora phragmitis TaxID=2905665 RepID=A0ABR1TVZ2_9PEZI